MPQLRPEENLRIFLQPTRFIDCDAPAIIEFAGSVTRNAASDKDKAVALYYAVRDRVRYSPYSLVFDPDHFRASWVLEQRVGFCVQKSILLAAAARAAEIPSRLGFADVRNHLATERLLALMRTDEFVFHCYTELHLGGRWVKATPAFNRSLCERFRVRPLEFDGKSDSIFHPLDLSGQKHMEYLRDHGSFADLPYDRMVESFCRAYPHLFGEGRPGWPGGEFEQEV